MPERKCYEFSEGSLKLACSSLIQWGGGEFWFKSSSKNIRHNKCSIIFKLSVTKFRLDNPWRRWLPVKVFFGYCSIRRKYGSLSDYNRFIIFFFYNLHTISSIHVVLDSIGYDHSSMIARGNVENSVLTGESEPTVWIK